MHVPERPKSAADAALAQDRRVSFGSPKLPADASARRIEIDIFVIFSNKIACGQVWKIESL
jgi:hypothetical protein